MPGPLLPIVAVVVVASAGAAIYLSRKHKKAIKGKSIAIIGGKGSGKTTLALCLAEGKLPDSDPDPTGASIVERFKLGEYANPLNLKLDVAYSMGGYDGSITDRIEIQKIKQLIKENDIVLYVFKEHEFNSRIKSVFKAFCDYVFKNDKKEFIEEFMKKIFIAVGTYTDMIDSELIDVPMHKHVEEYLDQLKGACKYGLVYGSLKPKNEKGAKELMGKLYEKIYELTEEEIKL